MKYRELEINGIMEEYHEKRKKRKRKNSDKYRLNRKEGRRRK